jgi:hypothetical protein
VLTDIEIQKDANRLRAKRKIEIVLQQWERHRCDDSGAESAELDNPQQDEGPAKIIQPGYKDVLMTEKQLAIDVQLRREQYLK